MTTAAIAMIATLSMAACGADESAELEDRVRELEDENSALRTQISALEAGVTTTTTTATSGDTSTSEDTATTDAPPPTDDSAPATSGGPDSATGATEVSTDPTATTTTTRPTVPGTRQQPHPAGGAFRAGDWTLTVTAFERNVDSVVAALSPDNPPPTTGNVFARMRLRAVYNGDGGGDAGRLRISLLSPTGTTVGTVDVCCDPQRDALADQPETFAGGVVEGWIYYEVTASDLFAGPFLAFDPNADQPGVPGGVVFFAVEAG